MGNRTPLYDAHVAAGAKIVDFAGWDMPLHYGSQLDEHHVVRGGAGMFDVSHMLAVDIAGATAVPFLRNLLANDIGKLREPGRALYSCMLNAAGGVIDDLIVYRFADENFRLVVNAGTAEKDLNWMRLQASALDAPPTITPRHDLALVAVQGPQARAACWRARPGWQAVGEKLAPFSAAVLEDGSVLARTGYTGEDGFELMLPAAKAPALWAALAAAGVRPVGLGARDTLRLEAGMNLYGQDMDETVTPIESGLTWTVALTEGRSFIGRDALLARPPQRQLLGLLLTERGVLRSHQKVISSQGPGETTSGSYAPTLGASIALARLPVGIVAGDTVLVDIRGKALAARVVKPPFVRHGKALV